jgi:hypothetical protein
MERKYSAILAASSNNEFFPLGWLQFNFSTSNGTASKAQG